MLLSVNVGRPGTSHGAVIRSAPASWKSPVTWRRMVRRLNVDGDRQGDLTAHGSE